jgi:formylglycine-generating enzyme required for sulfatase activity
VASNSTESSRPILAVAAVICLMLGGSSAQAQIINDDDPGLQAAENLVVMIDGRFNQPTQGAGVVFAVNNGYVYIATVFHVVRRSVSGEDRTASELKVRFHNDPFTDVTAEYVRADRDKVLSVIRAKAAGVNFNFARLGDMERVRNGLPAYAIGQPAKDWGVTYTPGPISEVGSIWLEVQSAYIQHGHSGGALIDQQGRIIGLVNETDTLTARVLRIDHVLDVLRLDLKLPVQLVASGASSPRTSPMSVAPAPAPPTPGEARANPKDGLTYRWIPPGSFRMGCSEQPADLQCDKTDEFPTHNVTISNGFWMGETEVTIAAYERYRAANKTVNALPTADSLGRKLNTAAGDPQLPVVAVTWDEAQAYCTWAGGGNEKLRLPSEAEWEYAARAGSRASRYGDLKTVAWYGDNSGKPINSAAIWAEVGQDNTIYNERLYAAGSGPHRVAGLKENAWNLRDMLGNVGEWTADWYDAGYYTNSPLTDPKGPTEAKQYRVLRGGSWGYLPGNVRVSYRFRSEPSDRNFVIGFRCAGELP